MQRLPRPAPVLVPDYVGYFDSLDSGMARGWVFDRASPDQRVNLHVVVDGQEIGQIVADQFREDLQRNLGDEQSHAGFEFSIPGHLADGKSHEISFRLPNRSPLAVFNQTDPRLPGDRMSFNIVPYLIQGNLDGIRSGKLMGWVIKRFRDDPVGRGQCQIEVTADGRRIATLRANTRRQDVANVVNCDANCGFELPLPPDLSRAMSHTFRVRVVPDNVDLDNSPLTTTLTDDQLAIQLAQVSDAMDRLFRDFVALRRQVDIMSPRRGRSFADYDGWARDYYRALSLRVAGARTELAEPPLVSVVVPAYRPLMSDFTAAIESVLRQTYPHWELIIVDDASRSPELTAVIKGFCRRDPRIKAVVRKKNGNISEATNTAIAAATGEWVALFDHDDMLVDQALEVMVTAALRTGADYLFSDEDKIDQHGFFSEPNFKPDWDHRYMLGCNYACHLSVVRRSVLQKVGPLRSEYNGAQDHDLILRIAEIVPEERIHHVPELLYHWRQTPNSTAVNIGNKDYARNAGVTAVQHHLDRLGWPAEVSSINNLTIYRVAWQRTATPRVCVVVPFREQIAITRRCLEKLRATEYPGLEILLVDNWSTSTEAAEFTEMAAALPGVRVLRLEEPFNFSRINNKAVAATDAEMICFMNNDLLVDEGWLHAALGEFTDPQVGAVGGLFRYPDDRVQHAGVVVGPDGIAAHGHLGEDIHAYGYIGRMKLTNRYTAVTAAGLLMPRQLFLDVGGFEEELTVAFNDVDLCLRIRAAGRTILFCADWTAEHHESLSRGSDDQPQHEKRFFYERQFMLDRWRGNPLFERDPAYSRFLTIDRRPFHDLQAPELG